MLLDAIMFVWKSGAVQSREGASELISLEKRIEKAVIIEEQQEGVAESKAKE